MQIYMLNLNADFLTESQARDIHLTRRIGALKNWHRTLSTLLTTIINVQVVRIFKAFVSSISVHNYIRPGIPWPVLDRATGLLGALHATFA